MKIRVSSVSHLLQVDLDKRSAISSARLSSPLGGRIHRITPQPQALDGGLEKGIGATHTLVGKIVLQILHWPFAPSAPPVLEHMTEKRCLGDKVFVVDTLKWSQIPNENHESQIFTYRGELRRSHLSDKKGWTVQAAPKSMPRTFNREFSASIEVNLCSRGGKSGSRTLLEVLAGRNLPQCHGDCS